MFRYFFIALLKPSKSSTKSFTSGTFAIFLICAVLIPESLNTSNRSGPIARLTSEPASMFDILEVSLSTLVPGGSFNVSITSVKAAVDDASFGLLFNFSII